MNHFLLLHSLFIPPIILSIVFLYKRLNTKYRKNRPPSPPKLPILGNLHQLGKAPHRSLESLSKKYGDLMLLHLGSKPTLVVSSANAAREIMQTHDVIFSNRPKTLAVAKLLYNNRDVASANYGEYWRQMKSLYVLQLLSNTKVRSFRAIREEETTLIVEKIMESIPSVVNLTETFVVLANHVVCRAAFGVKFSGEESANFMKLLNKFTGLLGEFSIGDFVPWLRWIDRLNGFEERLEEVAKQLDAVLERIVEEHQNSLSTQGGDEKVDKKEKVKDFVDVLLEVQRDKTVGFAIDKESIKALILDGFAAGTDTSSTAMEWVMAELIRHPTTMKKLQEEVRRIAQGKKMVTEPDLGKMDYLKAVIKETLRLHPPIPLLALRESREDVNINGYDIEAGTLVIVNAWAFQKDPLAWEDPNKFRPERFLTSSADYKGNDFRLIPFGAGRRICPGIQFAVVGIELVLANLVYKFDWKLPNGAKGEMLDMREGNFGLGVRKREPLLAVPTPYLCT